MTTKNKTLNPNRLPLRKFLAFKSSDVAQAGTAAIVLGFLSIYCTDTLGISTATVGMLLMASKIVDAFTDVFAGWLVDNTHSKLGKGRPYELSIIGVTLCSILMFSASPEWAYAVKCAWIFFTYTMVFGIFTTLRSAAQAPYMIRAFSNNQTVIAKVASYGGIITMFSSIAINIVFPIVMNRLATTATGWTKTIAIFMIPLTLIGTLRFVFVKEDPSVDAGTVHQKVSIKEIFSMLKINQYVWFYAGIMLTYNLITSLGVSTYYFKWIFGNMEMMSVFSMISIIILPVMFLFPVIMKKMGSMSKMISVFGFIGIAGYIVAFFAKDNFAIVLAGMTLASISTLPLAYYGILFLMKCCTYNEMKGMPRMDASTNILANFMSKFGSSFGSAITGGLLAVAGYVSGTDVTVQPDSALMMIRIIFAIIPAISVAIIVILVSRFKKLEDAIPAWEAEKETKNGVEKNRKV